VLRKILGLTATLGLLASSAVLLTSSPAEAARVANTGPVTFTFTQGSLDIGSEHFDASSSDDPITASGTIAANGTMSGITVDFPPIEPITGVPIVGTVHPEIRLIGSPSGSVNPLTGASTLSFTIGVWIPDLSSDCEIGPITINASTANAGGVPYNTTNGAVTWADHTFSVPGAEGCEYGFIGVNGNINDELGLPSGSGNNHAVFSAVSSPVLQRALVASFTATPSSGFAPLPVTFDASSTFHTRPITNHQWDLDGNGTFELSTGSTPTAATTYATAGTRTVRLRVTDQDGDTSETTRTVTVNTPLPDVTLGKSGPAAIVNGDPGTYTLSVGSEGQLPAAGATVVDTLPVGLTYTGSGGTGWSCVPAGQEVTCSSADVVNPGEAFPDLTIDVLADGAALGTVTNTATASTPTESDVSDNTDTADTLLVQPGIDLDVDKVHDAEDGLFAGQNATYVVSVGNDGTLPATDTVVVTDVLPAGTTFVGASGGLDWVCSESAGTVTCFSQEDIAPGEQLDDIRIIVHLTSVSSPLSNTASVEVTGESNPANDEATDTGEVLGFDVDYEILKTHVGDLVVGEPTTYGIGVQNIGTQTGGGTVTVTDDLPAGLTFVGASGDGWTCGAVGQLVTCEHPGGVEPGGVLPGITLNVVADASAIPSVTNTATVSGAGDVNAANDASSDPGTVRAPRPDLALSKTHQGNFTTGSNGTYTLSVRNVAVERADGPTVVVDSLPAGVTFVSAGGTGWTCDASALPQVACTYPGVIAGLATAPPISLVVHAPDGAPEVVVNGATVGNVGDTNPANDAAFDPTRIDRRQPAATVLEADAIVLRLGPGPTGAILSVVNAPYARLTTSSGAPVPGKAVTFRVLNQSQVICTAITDANGVASCVGDVLTYLTTLTSLRYTADFTGDVDFRAAHDEAAILHLLALKLI
jgi:uncharacterized repeat protein (TIGR01451 family)